MLIIFDCDGVLVDSELLHAEIFSLALASIGFDKTTEACLADMQGLSLAASYQFLEHEFTKPLPDCFFQLVEAMTAERSASELKATPGIAKTLQLLTDAGTSFCVASNARTFRVFNALRVANLKPYFAKYRIFGVDQVARGKPAPDIFLHAAKHMHYDVEACCVIEDSAVGVEAGIAAGMRVFQYVPNLNCDMTHQGKYIQFRAFDWLSAQF